ncbi:uncharacterized protein RJT21DRAFT_119575 [Scheffersomyces amazonensis]|uniref:uncharacterized protein n=1 Tax=Scheffersomyces amazonensis TaxID=1078765 RepID=UPI00315D2397
MSTTNLISKSLHSAAVRSLYREIIRRNSKLYKLPGTFQIKSNPKLSDNYKNISYELKIYINEQFRRNRSYLDKLSSSYLFGVQLIQILDEILNNNGNNIDSLVEIIDKYRQKNLKNQDNRASSKRNKLLKLKKKHEPFRFNNFNDSKKHSIIKETHKLCKSYNENVLGRYLRLQLRREKLPYPSKLLNTSEFKKVEENLRGKSFYESFRSQDFKSAYDQEYVESIIIPSLEYDINKYQYFNKFKWKITERGPAKVVKRVITAGPFHLSKLSLPYKQRNDDKKLAFDILKSNTLIRVSNVWNMEEGNTETGEDIEKDGSFAIKGSKGFGEREYMYPRYYYEELAESEGLWEFLLELEIHPNFILDKQLLRKKDFIIKSWTNPLQETTQVLESNLNDDKNRLEQYYAETHSPEVIAEIQKKVDKVFEKETEEYRQLVRKLKLNQVFKHSEIVNLGDRVSETYFEKFSNRSKSNNLEDGISQYERVGLGKTLGDYLAEAKYSKYIWGEKFYNRFKF